MMVKRFVAYILFAVAAINIFSIPIVIIGFRPLYGLTSAPPSVIQLAEMVVAITSLVFGLVIFFVGIIVLIKSRKN
jgi:hypothetical protein